MATFEELDGLLAEALQCLNDAAGLVRELPQLDTKQGRTPTRRVGEQGRGSGEVPGTADFVSAWLLSYGGGSRVIQAFREREWERRSTGRAQHGALIKVGPSPSAWQCQRRSGGRPRW